MPDNIFLENYIQSAEYECTKQAGKFHEWRERRLLQLFRSIMAKAM
jgi:hypothetical protein